MQRLSFSSLCRASGRHNTSLLTAASTSKDPAASPGRLFLNSSPPATFYSTSSSSISSRSWSICSSVHFRATSSSQSRAISRPWVTFNTGGAKRHCSYRRNMCKLHKDTEEAGGSLDIAKGREVLPKNVKPAHYDLTLEPNFETFKYDGKVDIE